jgi:hypothetical protein
MKNRMIVALPETETSGVLSRGHYPPDRGPIARTS